MQLDEDFILEKIEENINELENSLTFEIDGKRISNISKLPYKVVILTFSLHHRAVDIAKNSYSLYKDENYLSSAILTRSLMETSSLIFVAQKKVKQAVNSGKIGAIDDFLMRSIFGSKMEDDHIKSYNALTAIDHTDKEHEKYREMYDRLSEFVHPNWHGASGLYSKNEFNGKVKFGLNVDENTIMTILLPFLTTTTVLLLAFSYLSETFDDFIKLAEKDIIDSKD